ncbi:hypothetical protein Tco_1455295 [Tanacetum coccineum]
MIVLWWRLGVSKQKREGGRYERVFGDLFPCMSWVRSFVLSFSAHGQLRILALHLVFTFLSKLQSSSGVPSDFHNGNLVADI